MEMNPVYLSLTPRSFLLRSFLNLTFIRLISFRFSHFIIFMNYFMYLFNFYVIFLLYEQLPRTLTTTKISCLMDSTAFDLSMLFSRWRMLLVVHFTYRLFIFSFEIYSKILNDCLKTFAFVLCVPLLHLYSIFSYH